MTVYCIGTPDEPCRNCNDCRNCKSCNNCNSCIGSIIASVSDPVIHKKCINAYKKQTAIFFRNQFAELVKFIDLNNSGLTPATRMKIFNKSIQLISELDIKSEKELRVMQSKINLKILKIRHNVSDSFMYNELSNIVKIQSDRKETQ